MDLLTMTIISFVLTLGFGIVITIILKRKFALLMQIIRDLMSAQNELNISRDLYKEAIDSLPLSVCMLDSNGIVKFLNSKMQKTIELPYSEILNNRLFDLLEPNHCEKVNEVSYVAQNNNVINFIIYHTNEQKNGQMYDLLIEKL